MNGFIGREKELRFLSEAYNSTKSEFIPIYGRRRVGKSELIRHFMADKQGVYFLGKKEPTALILGEFMKEAARQLGEPLLASVTPGGWKEAFEIVLSRKPERKKLIIALDEFQWLAGASPELIAVVQQLWDMQWQHSRSVFLILCGSYMGFMEKEVLGKKSPLFGRRTGQILLKPFGYREAALFHKHYSLADKARTYFICGGIPLYLRFFSDNRSVGMNIAETFFNEFAPLYREAEFLLREELMEIEIYQGILTFLSDSSMTISAIAHKIGIDPRNMFYYLNNLTELGYVTRTYPLSDKKASARSVRYVIADPVLQFWFTYIFPNTSYIGQKGNREAFREITASTLESYYGYRFEHLSREALPLLYIKEGVMGKFETGSYWDKQVQIDVVGMRSDNRIDIGECKWGSAPSPARLASELQKKTALFPNGKNATLQPRIFTRRSLKTGESLKHIRFHSLEDLYRAD